MTLLSSLDQSHQLSSNPQSKAVTEDLILSEFAAKSWSRSWNYPLITQMRANSMHEYAMGEIKYEKRDSFMSALYEALE